MRGGEVKEQRDEERKTESTRQARRYSNRSHETAARSIFKKRTSRRHGKRR